MTGALPAPTYLSLRLHKHIQHFKLLPSSQLISLAVCKKFKTKSPSLPENITALNCRAQNRTDVLFKCQSRHVINHLHGLPHQGSHFWLSFIAWRHPHYGHFCCVVRCPPPPHSQEQTVLCPSTDSSDTHVITSGVDIRHNTAIKNCHLYTTEHKVRAATAVTESELDDKT